MAAAGQNMAEFGRAMMECPICLTSMAGRNPRALTCLHTFCEECLLGCVRNRDARHLNCPSCRKPTNLPPGGVSKLPINFFINQLASNVPDEQVDIVDSTTGKSPITASQKDMCSIHRKKLDYFCPVCVDILCEKCALLEKHRPHSGKVKHFLNEAAALTSALKFMKDDSDTHTFKMNEHMKDLQTTERLIDDHAEKTKERIDREVQNLKSKLRSEHVNPALNHKREVQELNTEIQKLLQKCNYNEPTKENIKQMVLHRKQAEEYEAKFEHLKSALPSAPKFVESKETSVLGHLSVSGAGSGSTNIYKGNVYQPSAVDLGGHIPRPSAQKFSGPQLAAKMVNGTRVRMVADGYSGRSPRTGKVTANYHDGFVWVLWDGGEVQGCCMGASGRFELELVEEN